MGIWDISHSRGWFNSNKAKLLKKPMDPLKDIKEKPSNWSWPDRHFDYQHVSGLTHHTIPMPSLALTLEMSSSLASWPLNQKVCSPALPWLEHTAHAQAVCDVYECWLHAKLGMCTTDQNTFTASAHRLSPETEVGPSEQPQWLHWNHALT
jgi:hypothetical protein